MGKESVQKLHRWRKNEYKTNNQGNLSVTNNLLDGHMQLMVHLITIDCHPQGPSCMNDQPTMACIKFNPLKADTYAT